jgi:enoyl-[acyl-carrier protein] reductase II
MNAREENVMFKTRICEMLGIEHPIVQAGMGGVALGELAGAVSEAGGLGVIGAAMMTPEQLREQIQKVRSLTDKPFGVDLLLAEGAPGVQEALQVMYDEKVPVFVSGLGNPGPLAVEMHGRGMKIVALVGNVRNARRCAEADVDIIVAQGHEAGGHTGRVATLALVPQVVDAVRSIPVLAAGGIADGRGLVASLALGAEGVLVGTRFIATDEASSHVNYKQRLVAMSDEDTIVSRAYTGKTCRVVRNLYTEEWRERESELKPFPLQIGAAGEHILGAMVHGEMERGFAPAGQISGGVHEVVPAGEVVRSIIEEGKEVLRSLAAAHLGAGVPGSP